MKKEFIKWMKSKRLWSKFKREFENGNLFSYQTSIRHYINKHPESRLISYAFLWCDTQDGKNLWAGVSKQWKDHLKNILKIKNNGNN